MCAPTNYHVPYDHHPDLVNISLCLCASVLKNSVYLQPVQQHRGEDSEPTPKEIPNLKNLKNFPNQVGKIGGNAKIGFSARFANLTLLLTTTFHF